MATWRFKANGFVPTRHRASERENGFVVGSGSIGLARVGSKKNNNKPNKKDSTNDFPNVNESRTVGIRKINEMA